MRLIDADALYEKLKNDEDLARQRVIDTPNTFPDGSLNPAVIRNMAQLSEITRLKEIVYDMPIIEPEPRPEPKAFLSRSGSERDELIRWIVDGGSNHEGDL